MSEFKEKRFLPYKAENIFDLVMDIEKYPEFLPWCKKARIVENLEDGLLLADLVVSFKGFVQSYRSKVRFFEEGGVYVVAAQAVEGPFEKLLSIWRIKDLKDDGCEIEFEVEFLFRSKILQKMAGAAFSLAVEKMVGAFEKRAREMF